MADETPEHERETTTNDGEAPRLDPDDLDQDPLADEDLDEEEASRGPLRAFFGLFLVPLLVVLVCVGVFVGFGWLAYDRQDVGDYLNDLRSGWKPRRAQAAYELAKVLIADPEALAERPDTRQELRDLFTTAEDREIRRYLALVLGYTRDPAAVPLLTAALDSESDSQSRIYLLWALGANGDSGALPALIAALAEEDAGIRKTAAYALGELGDRSVVPRLEPLLGDGTADVRWNAALALARQGSDADVPELERMVDRELLARVPEITPVQQEDAMISAIRALAVLRGDSALPLFERLERDDPSLKVRQAAIEARRALGADD